MTLLIAVFNYIKWHLDILLLVCLFGVIIYWLIIACIKARKDQKELLQELEEPYVEPRIFEYKAIVVEKYFTRKNLGGVKMPKTKECCCAVFKTQDGKLWDEEVSLEEFSQLQENQSVIIGVADGRYCGFCLDE